MIRSTPKVRLFLGRLTETNAQKLQSRRVFLLSCCNTLQVVVLNKIDLPEVRSRQAELEEHLKAELGHSRFMAIR